MCSLQRDSGIVFAYTNPGSRNSACMHTGLRLAGGDRLEGNSVLCAGVRCLTFTLTAPPPPKAMRSRGDRERRRRLAVLDEVGKRQPAEFLGVFLLFVGIPDERVLRAARLLAPRPGP